MDSGDDYPTSDIIVHLVECKCLEVRCATNRCQYRKAGLNCTDLCGCCGTDDGCENIYNDTNKDEDYDDDDKKMITVT